MIGEHDRGRTDPCANHIDGRRTLCERVEGANGPFTVLDTTKNTILFLNFLYIHNPLHASHIHCLTILNYNTSL